MGRKRYFIQGEAAWEGLHLQELWEQEVAVLTPLAIRYLSCSRLQAVQLSLFLRWRSSCVKITVNPRSFLIFPSAVRVFCDQFPWDHWPGELWCSVGRGLRQQVRVRESQLRFRGSFKKSCRLLCSLRKYNKMKSGTSLPLVASQ